MRSITVIVLSGLFFCKTSFCAVASRIWTSSDGRQIEAKMLDAFGGDVLILRGDGQSYRLPMVRLSQADRQYVAKALQPIHPKLSPLQAVVLIRGDSGAQGTGFLLQHLGGIHLVTNAHVVRGSARIEAVQIDGRPIVVGDQMEMAIDGRDLVRFPVSEVAGGLVRSPELKLGEPCYALGNSGGLNVLTPLPGRMVGAGPKEIEVTCPFIPGNSGGPILTARGQVMGVATYISRSHKEWWAQGTRFANVRRVAVRLDGVEWRPVSLSSFKKAAAILDKVKKDIAGIEHWKNIIKTNPRHPDAKDLATKLIRMAAGLGSGVSGISAVSRIPFLQEDAAQAGKYNKELQEELRKLLRLVREK